MSNNTHTYTQDQLKKIIEDHCLYLQGDPAGKQADLHDANLQGANLQDAYLHCADLSGANLRGANLRDANLQGANLRGADLRGADLRDADLRDANLRDADLRDANLYDEDLKNICHRRLIVPESGSFTVYKKVYNRIIVTLLVPAKAARVGGLTDRKCRVEYAKVLAMHNPDGTKFTGKAYSMHDNNFEYEIGKIVKPDSFDPDPLKVCAPGIHCFITKREAEEY